MNITCNGKTIDILEGENLAGFIRGKSLKPERILAELNGEILQAVKWESAILKENDILELISFVGGG